MFPILQNQSVLTITSIELHALINSCREKSGESLIRLNDFHARVVDELDGDHYENFVVQNPNKTESKAYKLTIEQSTLIGMRESKAVRRSVIDQLKKYSQPQFNIPQTLPEALRLAADLADQLEQAKPKLAVYDLLADRKGDVSTTIVAKELGTTAFKLNKFLRDKGVKWLNADLPKAGFEKWFNVVCDVKNNHEFTQCLIAPEGQLKIAQLWAEKNNKKDQKNGK